MSEQLGPACVLASAAEDDPAEVYEVSEYAQKVKMSDQAVRAAIRAGRVKAFRLGRAWKIPKGPADKQLRGEA